MCTCTQVSLGVPAQDYAIDIAIVGVALRDFEPVFEGASMSTRTLYQQYQPLRPVSLKVLQQSPTSQPGQQRPRDQAISLDSFNSFDWYVEEWCRNNLPRCDICGDVESSQQHYLDLIF